MDLYRAPVTASIPPSPLKTSGKRLRRKLQKIGSQQREYPDMEHYVRFIEPNSYDPNRKNCDTSRRSCDTSRKSLDRSRDAPQNPQYLPLPSNLSELGWSDFIRKSSFRSPNSRRVSIQSSDLHPQTRKPVPSRPQQHSQPRQSIVHPPKPQLGIEQARSNRAGQRRNSASAAMPELNHLSISNPKPRRVSQPSFDSDTTYARAPFLTTSTSSERATIKHRRHAKTPVYAIGQLELSPQERQRVLSSDRIAEGYKALLETPSLVWSEQGTEAAEAAGSACGHESRTPDRRRYSLRESYARPEARSPKMSIGSPCASDVSDTTLVDSDEDATYIKPDSPCHVAPLPLRSSKPGPRPSQARPIHPNTIGNPGLQIAVDLLTRELSSAAKGIPLKPGSETSALQVWVMIEAYEKLRDQVLERRMPRDQERAMLAMFDTWLQALERIHDEMTGHDGQVSESVYNDAPE